MKPGTTFREPVRVVMHLNGGFTKVVLERGGSASWDIPTERIPLHLRGIGSRFLMIAETFTAEPSDSADAMRAAMHDVVVEELV